MILDWHGLAPYVEFTAYDLPWKLQDSNQPTREDIFFINLILSRYRLISHAVGHCDRVTVREDRLLGCGE